MSVIALKAGYAGEIKDREENFHGNQLLFVGWEDHLMFCAPHCIPVAPTTPFNVLASELLPAMYSIHPDWQKVDLRQAEWFRSGQAFTPDFDKTLRDNGLGHKAVIRFRTPGLTGIGGSCS
ncbi:phenol hydroxylase subunit P4 [Trinickia mobilis]|uniref:phenol hydroxylase subunit P4 n=1 Tax=Trinickia mobilis TaxID=2816356 RepID=UPI001A8D6D75|nr:phenol hydroxylase subunit P4 [Trinickia mobilis]